MVKKIIILGLFLVVILFLTLYLIKSKSTPIQQRTLYLMDTYWTLKIPGDSSLSDVMETVFKRLKEIDQKFSIDDQSGQIYGFNKLNKPITDPEIIAVIKKAKALNERTCGAFDITVGPLLDAYGFYSRHYHVLTQQEVAELLKHVGMDKLDIQTDRITKNDPDVGIDLGGIAKSYAINEALRIVRERGIKNALIDGGGILLP